MQESDVKSVYRKLTGLKALGHKGCVVVAQVSEVRQQRAIFRDFGEISSLQINGLGHFLTPN
jgi:hypothetical protein